MNKIIDLIIDIKVDIDEFFENSFSLAVLLGIQIIAYMGGFIVAINGDKGLGTFIIISSCVITLFIIVMLAIKLKDTIIFMKGRKTK